MQSVSLKNLTTSTLPRVPFAKIKNTVLGNTYDLSVVFVGNKKSQELNRTYRGKDKPTNILSFPINSETGEIFINLPLCKKECSSFGRTYTNFIGFLFIHGLLHLKGYEHGSTMESEEKRYRKQYSL